jgi:hypothetical protein
MFTGVCKYVQPVVVKYARLDPKKTYTCENLTAAGARRANFRKGVRRPCNLIKGMDPRSRLNMRFGRDLAKETRNQLLWFYPCGSVHLEVAV